MNKLILSKDRSEEASALLNSWANCFLTLENKYYVKRNEVSNRDYGFLKLIGQSVYYLNSSNSLLIASIEKFNKRCDDRYLTNELDSLSKYMRFFNSLVASKIKFFFFRETPIKNTNNPFVKIDLPILKSGNNLIKELSKDKICVESIIISASKYFYLQTLLYSFTYHSKKEKGVFLKFKYDKKKYYDINKIIIDKYDNSSTEQDIRFLGSNIIAYIANYYLDDDKKCDINNSFIKKPDCYDNLFLKLLSDNEIMIEPLTYHLSDILWKIDGLIHDDNEHLESLAKQSHDSAFIGKLKEFVYAYFRKTSKMYENDKIDYSKLYKIEKKFIEEFIPLVFESENIKTVRAKFKKISELHDDSQNNGKILLPIIRHSKNDLINVFNKVRDSGKQDFKIGTLIEVLNADDLTLLFNRFSKLISKKDINDKKTAFVGFYKSGIFLGHINNLINNCKKPIWLFKAKPYVATHPVHEDENYDDLNKIIIFDESLKTGFTYSLYESYLTRNLCNSHLSTALYALFDFTYYTRIEFRDNVNFHSLIKLNDVDLPTNSDELDMIKKIDSAEVHRELGLKNIGIENALDLIKYSNSSGEPKNRVDLTYLLSDTQTIFYICNLFAEKIIKNSQDKIIYLSTGSSDGDVLILLTAFILKLKKKKIKFGFKTTTKNDVFLVAIDLSLITGFSLAYLASMEQNNHYNNDDIESGLNKFDLICSIVSSSNDRINSFSLYHTN